MNCFRRRCKSIEVVLKNGETIVHEHARRALFSLPFWMKVVSYCHGKRCVHWYQRREVVRWNKMHACCRKHGEEGK